MRPVHLLAGLLAVAACGDDGESTPIDAPVSTIDAPGDIDAPPVAIDADIDAPLTIDAPDLRGPTTVDLTGGANSLYWDATSSTLFFTDNNTNSLMKYTDTGGVETVIAFPATTGGASLGDIAKRGGGGGGGGGMMGGYLVANFGFGQGGTIFRLNGMATQVTNLTGLDPARRRIGLSIAPDGTIYDAYFTGGGGNPQVGGVSTVVVTNNTSATETEIAGSTTTAGFKQVVGLVATNDAVYVADQTDKKIYKISRPGNVVSEHATVPSADLLALMPNGDLLGGGDDIYRITPAGVVTTLIADAEQVRGMAFDDALNRIFYIEHSTTAGVPDKLQIRPLDN